jgi:hypothetical protein
MKYVAHIGEMGNAHKILVRRPDGNRRLGSHRRRREDNIKVDFKEM